MKRCRWCTPNNPLYIKYHDEEWGVLNLDDSYLYEMLLLESFQAGLSWECVLNKRKNFRKAFSNFNVKKIAKYNDKDIERLMNDKGLIRNRLKINATINNAKIFISIKQEYGAFANFLKTFWDEKVIIETNKVTNDLSNVISKDLIKRGMKFVGSTIIYAYLQAIGIINGHEKECDKYIGE